MSNNNSYEGENRRRAMRREQDIDFSACPKYNATRYKELTDDEKLKIAVMAVEIAKDNFAQDIGKTVLNKFFWALGIATIAFMTWLNSTDFMKGH